MGPQLPKKTQVVGLGSELGDSGSSVDLKARAIQDVTFVLLGIWEEIAMQTMVMQQQLQLSRTSWQEHSVNSTP